MSPGFIPGVINLRGNVVPVLDLAARVGFELTRPDKRPCIVIIDLAMEELPQRIGLVVDAVDAVDLAVVVVDLVVDLVVTEWVN